jgi:O-antigen/teichoic acid export membrane protein
MQDLKRRILRSSGWTFVGHGLSQVLRMGGNLVMTRLLAPDMFGLMAIANMVMIGLAMFSDLGIRQSIVQSRQGDDATFLNTAWAMQIVRGLTIGGVTVCLSLVAYAVAWAGWFPDHSVYADSRLPAVIAVLSACAVIAGFESTSIAQASRRLSLAGVTMLELKSQTVGLVSMMFWASVDRSVWALVCGAIVAALSRCIWSHVSLDGIRNRWQWNGEALKELASFGKWIFLSSIFGFLVNNADRLILGGLVSTEILGVYTVAFLLVNAVESALVKFMGDVAYPAFSETGLKHREALKKVFYKFQLPIGSLSFLLAGLMYSIGPTVVRILYDARYVEAGWMLSVLSVGLVMLPYRTAGLCLMAVGSPKVLTMQIGLRLMLLCVLTLPIYPYYGLQGVLWVIVLSATAGLPVVWAYQWSSGLLDIRKELMILPFLPFGLLLGRGLVRILESIV